MEVMTVVSPQIPYREFESIRIVSPTKKDNIPEEKRKMEFNMMTCKKCSEDFSEERIPRILVCGHSMCCECVKVPNCEIVCSECNKKSIMKKDAELPVNYPLLRLIRSMGDNKIDFDGMIKRPSIITDVETTDVDGIKTKCSVHGNTLSHFCCVCSAWACHDCLVTEHRYLPRGSCKLLKLKDGMSLVKREHKCAVDKISKDVRNMKRTFELDMGLHEFCQKHCLAVHKTYHIYLVEMVDNKIEEVKKETYSFVDKMEEFTKKSTELAEKTESPEEIANSLKDVTGVKRSLEEDIEKLTEKKSPVLKVMVEHFKLDLKLLVKGGTPVYAVTLEGDGPMWTEISLKDTLLSLYSLKKGKPPKDGIVIPYEYAKHTYPKDETTIFFDVGTEAKEMGRICIKLDDGENELCKQMTLMCSGEKGVSYKGTCFYEFDQNEGRLHGGDYENNNGTGGRPILNELSETYGRWIWPGDKQTGRIMCDRMSTRFYFFWKYNRNGSEYIGKVISGLNTIKSLSKTDMEKHFIKDCGIVIPMRSSEVKPEVTESEEVNEEWGR